MPRGGRNTKDEIIRIGMELFVEQGYDKTTLREIADHLGVTKAALYYHFNTKEDIVHAAMEAHADRMDDLVTWVREQPPGPERDRELVDRLVETFGGSSNLAMQFTQANPTVLRRPEFGERRVDQITRLIGAIAGPTPNAEKAVRAVGAFGALLVGVVDTAGAGQNLVPGTRAERESAARTVALEMLRSLRAD